LIVSLTDSDQIKWAAQLRKKKRDEHYDMCVRMQRLTSENHSEAIGNRIDVVDFEKHTERSQRMFQAACII
jgi:hypothetical protein